MRVVDLIRKKRDGHELTDDEIGRFVRGASDGTWHDYQLAALLMAICCRGMTAAETAALTAAMASSGVRVTLPHLPGPKVGKHSTGGVGDKTTLVLAPLVAACGAWLPKMSGRGLGHSGGTLDKLESIAGFRARLPLEEFRAVVTEVGFALAGPTAEIAPADRTLYALRDVTGTVESVPLITASILSKKLAEGIDALVLDVKCGHGAFMKDQEQARTLGRALASTGHKLGLTTEAVLTAMDAPLGRAVGNALEVREAVQTLRGQGPADLATLSVYLAARLVRLAGLASTLQEAEQKVRQALDSGRGLEKFRQVIARQGGDVAVLDDLTHLPSAAHTHDLKAPRAGHVAALHAERIGVACVLLGAGREHHGDAIDHAVGAMLHVVPGQAIRAGEVWATVHYTDPARLGRALPYFEKALTVADAPTPSLPLILETLEATDG